MKQLSKESGRRTVTTRAGLFRKPVNANPGLKVNRSINFPCIKMVFASYFLFGLRLFKVA